VGRPHAVLEGHQRSVVAVAFAAGGEVLISSSWDGTSRLWDPWARRELRSLAGAARQVSRDGQRLAVLSGRSLALWEVAPGRGLRTLPRSRAAGQECCNSLAFSPDGRFLLGSTRLGVWVWDLAGEKEAVLLPLSNTKDAQFHPSGKELFTSGDAGLHRWTVRTQAGALRIGPARKVLVPGPLEGISLDGRGRVLTVAGPGGTAGSRILWLDRPPEKAIPVSHDMAVFATTSPNGQWAATGTWNGFGVKVWEAHSGRLLRHLIPEERISTVAFSLDGRWLATGTGTALALWKVGSWELAREVPRQEGLENPVRAAFAGDGKLLALTPGPSVVQLIDPATGRPVARLEASDSDPVWCVAFSPEGSRLAVGTTAGNVRVWDLRWVRQRLKELGLDWDPPAYRHQQHDIAERPVRVEAELADFQRLVQANDHYRQAVKQSAAAQWSGVIESCSRAIELDPTSSAALHLRACSYAARGEWKKADTDLATVARLAPGQPVMWYQRALLALALGDAAGYRKACATVLACAGDSPNPEDALLVVWACVMVPGSGSSPRQVVALAEQFHARGPRDFDGLAALGAALYRAGRFKEAAERLRQAEAAYAQAKSPRGTVVYSQLFLCMAEHRLGHRQEAQQWLERAVRALDPPGTEARRDPAAQTWNRQLTVRLLRAEAEALVKAPRDGTDQQASLPGTTSGEASCHRAPGLVWSCCPVCW
jgi:WD40 repeat protein/Flp pilus assembly protein TadD